MEGGGVDENECGGVKGCGGGVWRGGGRCVEERSGVSTPMTMITLVSTCPGTNSAQSYTNPLDILHEL